MRKGLLAIAAFAAGAVLVSARAQGETTIAIPDSTGEQGAVVSVPVSMTTDIESVCVTKEGGGSKATCKKKADCTGAGEFCDGVAGTQNDISFGAKARILGVCVDTTDQVCLADSDCPEGETCTGGPACVVNSAIKKGGTSFAFLPSGCALGDCTGVRALVLALNNVDPIPTGSKLYTCQVKIADDAAGDQPLTCEMDGASNGGGQAIMPVDCPNAKVSVDVGGTPTNTPEATPTNTEGVGPTDTPTASPTITPTNTVPPPTAPATATNTVQTPTPQSTATHTKVPTSTKKPTITPGGGGGNDDDGCAIVAPSQSSAAWMLLLPAAALLWLRRRSR